MYLTKVRKSLKWQNNKKKKNLTSLRKIYSSWIAFSYLFFKTKQLILFSFLWLSKNIKTYPPRNLKFVNENYIFFHTLLFFKNNSVWKHTLDTVIHTLDTMIWKTILSSNESKISEYADNQNIINLRWEIGILLKIILNVIKRSTVSLSTENLILAIAPLSFISVAILCEFAILPDVYILLSPQEEEARSSSWGDRCTHLEAHSSKLLNTLPVIILVCLGNT